jgi:CDP-diacylglycerol--glycerol-3-phosphate 3-phosphatidyltransferase
MNDQANQQNELQFTNAPNLLTLSRILLAPVVMYLLYLRTPFWDVVAAWVFAAAATTDFFDGYLARKRNLITVYGQLMDPLADKFLVVSSLCMLQELGRINVVVVVLLICREMAITGLRALASSEGLIIGASRSAKWKTATQMVAIPFLMAQDAFFGIPLFILGRWLIWISLAISLWSAKDYIVDFFRALSEKARLRREARKEAKKEKKQTRE